MGDRATAISLQRGRDAAGNVTNDGTHTYQYDAENRLIKIDGGSTARCASDPQGERVSKIAESGLDYFCARYYASAHGRWREADLDIPLLQEAQAEYGALQN